MYRSLVLNITGLAGTGKSSTVERLSVGSQEIAVFRPSDVLRKYAGEHAITLSSREDYQNTRDMIIAGNPRVLIDPVLELAQIHPLVLVDGMRVYEDALAIQKELDSTSKVYKTAILVCPDTVRAQRILRDSDRQYRDTARLTTQQEILADEQADLNGSYNLRAYLTCMT